MKLTHLRNEKVGLDYNPCSHGSDGGGIGNDIAISMRRLAQIKILKSGKLIAINTNAFNRIYVHAKTK
jgi:hypothetical protein